MHHCAHSWCWRMSIIGMNYWVSFNIVMTCVIILIDTPCAVQVVNIFLILSYLLFMCPSSCPFMCPEYYKLCFPLLLCLNTRAESDFYKSSFDVSVGWIFDRPVRCSLIQMKLWELSVVPGICWAMTMCNLVDPNNKPPSWVVSLFQNFSCHSNSVEVKYIFYIYYIYLVHCNMQCKPYITIEVEVSKLFK
jgi:hypothetical protein